MLHEAISAIQMGEKTRARDLLTRLIRTNPGNPDYWLWMSSVVETIKERTYCLQEALHREPANASARRGLVMLGVLPPEEMVSQVGQARRNWLPLYAEPEPESRLLTRQSTPRLVLGIAGVIVLVSLVGLAIWRVSGPNGGFQARPAALSTPKPTATLLATGTSVVRSPTPTFIGPTPLWMYLEQTYTPTPLYVNTPHPRTEAYRSGMRAFQRGDWTALINFMEQVVAAEPGAADAYYYIGEGYRQRGECGNALEQYNLAIQTNPNFAPSYLARARCHFTLNPKADVQSDLDRALELDPGMAEARLELAQIAIERSDPEAALEQLNEAVQTLPESPLVYLLRAQAEMINDQPREAADDAKHANELDITLLEPYRVMGEAYQANEELDLSIKPLETYTRYVSDDAQAWVMLGRAYHSQKKDEAAMEAFTKALKLNNRLLEAYLGRGQIYLDQGENNKALDDLSTAVLINTKSFAANLGKGRAFLALGYPGDAYMAIDRATPYAETDGERASLYYWRARSLDALGREDAAQRDWLALQALPEDAVPQGWLEEAALKITSTATQGPKPTITKTATATPRPKVTSTPTQNKR